MSNPSIPTASRPKRLLSIDGGGIRGLMEAEVLIEIEHQLKDLTGQDRPLRDYFDLIGGTSTGAILAAGLAMGMRAADLRDFYFKYGHKVFSPVFLPVRLWHKYPRGPLVKALQEVLGSGTTLGDPHLRTMLMIVSKNASLGSTWFFVNNPAGKYFPQNQSLPLWQIVRASSAAPTYFPPETIPVMDETGTRHRYDFVDGGVSTYNNPSMQLFLEATEPAYNIGWPAGAQNLLLVSLGAGFSVRTIAEGKAACYTDFNWAAYAVDELMSDANLQQNVLMHLIGERPVAVPAVTASTTEVSKVVGAPDPAAITRMSMNLGDKKLLTYQRITVQLSRERLTGLGLPDIDPAKVCKLDCVDQMDNLQRIGRAIAKEQVNMTAVRNFFLQ